MAGDVAASPSWAARVGAWWRSAVRFGNGVLGADRYQRYLEYHRATGCEREPLTERQFWRDYQDWQDAHPEGRCC